MNLSDCDGMFVITTIFTLLSVTIAYLISTMVMATKMKKIESILLEFRKQFGSKAKEEKDG